jgi:hypothetical protein
MERAPVFPYVIHLETAKIRFLTDVVALWSLLVVYKSSPQDLTGNHSRSSDPSRMPPWRSKSMTCLPKLRFIIYGDAYEKQNQQDRGHLTRKTIVFVSSESAALERGDPELQLQVCHTALSDILNTHQI